MPARAKKDSRLVGAEHALGTAKRNALPDKAFAFPEQRKEPLTDARHVRSAIRLFGRVKDVSDASRDRAWRRIRSAARRFGVDVEVRDWHEVMGRRRRPKSR
jgi:hypothetical protein